MPALVLPLAEQLPSDLNHGVKARISLLQDRFSVVTCIRPGPSVVAARFEHDHPQPRPVRLPPGNILPANIGFYHSSHFGSAATSVLALPCRSERRHCIRSGCLDSGLTPANSANGTPAALILAKSVLTPEAQAARRRPQVATAAVQRLPARSAGSSRQSEAAPVESCKAARWPASCLRSGVEPR